MKNFLSVVAKSIFFLGCWTGLGLFTSSYFDRFLKQPALWRMVDEARIFIIVLAITILFYLIEKGKISIGLLKNIGSGIATGIIFGVIWIIIPVGVLYGLGFLKFSNFHMIAQLPLWVLAIFFHASMLELLVRGYWYQLLKSEYNMIVAMLVTTAFFTLIHSNVFETGIVAICNIVTMSIFMTLLLEYTKSLIAPIIAHFVWNLLGKLLDVISSSIFLPDDYPSMITASVSGDTILSGGVLKLDGSIIIFTLNLLFIGFLILGRKIVLKK